LKPTPFISICIPTYKNAIYVERLLGSILEQSYKDFEIVITDNSPDNAVELVAGQMSDRLPIRYYRNDPPTQMAANFNEGLKKAKGQWVKMMHDDDWFASPVSLARFAEVAMKTRSKFIFSACKNIHARTGKIEEEMLVGRRKEMLEDDYLSLIYLNVIGHPSTVMHYNDPGVLYDTEFKWVVDIEFYLRFMEKYPGFDYIPDFLVNIGIDENQMSGKLAKDPGVVIPEYLALLAKYPADMASKNMYAFHMLWNLVKKFKVQGLGDIEKLGYRGPVPGLIEDIIQYQKYIPHIILKQTPWSASLMKRCFRQISITT